jgi:uncharacterized protein with PIN domain
MIVIDTSALVAILNREPERIAFFEVIAAADRCLVSAGRAVGVARMSAATSGTTRSRHARPCAGHPRLGLP